MLTNRNEIIKTRLKTVPKEFALKALLMYNIKRL